MAHMGEPEAKGVRRVALCHLAVIPVLPGVEAAARNRLQPATTHPIHVRRWQGAVGRVRNVALRHCAKLYPLHGPRGRRCAYRGGGGCRAGMTGYTIQVAPCPNIPPGWSCPWACCRAALGWARCGAHR